MNCIVDILSPVGGKEGGVEEVIKSWVKNLNPAYFIVRVIHMTPGRAYLNGYPYAYSFNGPQKSDDIGYYVKNYADFIAKEGAPHICVATNWPIMCVAANVTRQNMKLDFRIFSWVHNRIEPYYEAGLGGVAHLTFADEHLVLNSHNARLILKQNPSAKVHIVGNPVNMPELINVEKTPFLLAYIGRLADVKRVDIILEAMYRARDYWKLKIIGTGEMEAEWKEIVKFLKLTDRVEFLGWQNNPCELVRDAIAVVGASEYEGFMLTSVESLSVGTQVICTPVDGVVDYIKPGVNGYLFPQENAGELARILDMIGSGELPVCEAEACRESVMQYETKAYFDNIEKIFRESVKL